MVVAVASIEVTTGKGTLGLIFIAIVVILNGKYMSNCDVYVNLCRMDTIRMNYMRSSWLV